MKPPLLASLALALLLCGCKEPTPTTKTDDAAKAVADSRKHKILSEIAAIGDHPWAGDYYGGDGMGVNRYLTLAPKSGFVFEWHGCMGLYDRNYGPVTFHDGAVIPEFTFPNVDEGFQGLWPKLIPVRWGDRHYLADADGLIEFCNAYNCNPRRFSPYSALLRVGDEKKPCRGKPEVPAAYARYLLDKPVTAAVVAIGEPTFRTTKYGQRVQSRLLTLSAGENAGLLPGMKLHVVSPDSVCESLKITRVTRLSCEAQLTLDCPEELEKFYKRKPTPEELERHIPTPTLQWAASTRASFGQDLEN